MTDLVKRLRETRLNLVTANFDREDAASALESLSAENAALSRQNLKLGDLHNEAEKHVSELMRESATLLQQRNEAFERAAKVADELMWTLPLYAPEENINVAVGEAANIVVRQLAAAIRQLSKES